MVPNTPAEVLAAQELESIRSLHLYADRKLIQQGRYLTAARQLERRGWLAKWVGVGGSVFWVAKFLTLFGSTFRAQESVGLSIGMYAIALAAIALPIVMVAYCYRVHKRTVGVLHRVTELFSVEPEPGHESPAA